MQRGPDLWDRTTANDGEAVGTSYKSRFDLAAH